MKEIAFTSDKDGADIREIVVVSGKGGTGKTSLVASFGALAGDAVFADCDVDAADLYLVLDPTIQQREKFRCGREAVIRQEDCVRCGACLARCRFEAVVRSGDLAGDAVSAAPRGLCKDCAACVRSCPVKVRDFVEAMQSACGGAGDDVFAIDPMACEGCGVCVAFCPVKAIDFPERVNGEWFRSDTRHGPLVHARLNPGGENSGKLVSKVREAARQTAALTRRDLILVDGPPGVGCAVIASITGASLVLIVAEPTLSGAHDLQRVLELAAHFRVPAAVCVNKWDLNAAMAEQIETRAVAAGARLAGRIRYDRAVTAAQVQGRVVVEIPGAAAGEDIRAVWEAVSGCGGTGQTRPAALNNPA
jgi:MinD superfamily P-loop ATPase